MQKSSPDLNESPSLVARKGRMMKMKGKLGFALVMAVLGCGGDSSESQEETAATQSESQGETAETQTQRTTFDPATQGFVFRNTFQNIANLPAGVNVRTGGLCGGMTYAALDYYNARRAPPRQSFRPAEGAPLQQYLYARQLTSLESNVDKWAEVSVNPLGGRDTEFFNWGLDGRKGGRIEELRSFIDRGVPVPLGLKADKGGDHQVLAIGYDLGGYRGDFGTNAANFKIFIYDPNHPKQTMTLSPDLAGKVYKYTGNTDGDSKTWRTYFVDKNYHAQQPPSLPESTFPNDGKVHQLVLAFTTGADDLRGGKDNVDLTVNLHDGTQQQFPAVNLRQRWISNYTQNAVVSLQPTVPLAMIRSLVLTVTFSGGVSGDNWDMEKLNVYAVTTSDENPAQIKTAGFKRFTGSDKVLTVPISEAPPSSPGQVTHLTFDIRTGGDDLRGGNDNLNVTLVFADGSEQVVSNVNNSARWANDTTHSINVTLNKPVQVSEIRSVILSTTSGGGIGGDNWNMESVNVNATVDGVSRQVANGGPMRFTGHDKQLVVPVH